MADQRRENPISVVLAEPGEDIELKAIAWIWSVLERLSGDQRDRVLTFLSARSAALKTEESMIEVSGGGLFGTKWA